MSNLMTWPVFVEKLVRAKKEKKNKGLAVPAITNLIFSGAFDGMLDSTPEDEAALINKYHEMYHEVRDALKSKASLPKAKKGEAVGLEDVASPASLAFWRYQINPLSKFNMLDLADHVLKGRGFDKNGGRGIFTHRRDPQAEGQKTEWVTDRWSDLFLMPKEGERGAFWQSITKGIQSVVLVGVISEAKTLRYANGTKERLSVSLYTGRENVRDLVIWPKKDGRISEMQKATIKPPAWGLFWVRPQLWNGKKTGMIDKWEELL